MTGRVCYPKQCAESQGKFDSGKLTTSSLVDCSLHAINGWVLLTGFTALDWGWGIGTWKRTFLRRYYSRKLEDG
jgi:hypothetical protein